MPYKDDGKIEICVDRSRYECSLGCEREFYWAYQYGGLGLGTKGTPYYFAVGEAVHIGVQMSMLGYSWPETRDAVMAVFQKEMALTDEGVLLAGEALQEKLDLAPALVYNWRKQRLPMFLSEYRVLDLPNKAAIEQEINVPIFETDKYRVILMCRPDIIAERILDKNIMIWELKTAGVANDAWIKKWEHAFQLLLQVYATQFLLDSIGHNKPVVGIVVEGLIKGQRKKDSFGVKKLSNSLIYGYVKRGDGFIIKDQWSPSWKKYWNKELVSMSMPIEQWIDALPEETLLDYCRVVPPLMADGEAIQSVLRQVGHRSIQLYEQAQVTKSAHAAGSTEWRLALDELWPQNFENCHQWGGTDCPFLSLCFMHQCAEDPLSAGYVERVPNHKFEIGG